MTIYRCPIARDWSSYDSLKKRHVVAQGWSGSGDVSFFIEEKDQGYYLPFFVDNEELEKVGRVFKVLTRDAQAGNIFIATQGGAICGICELPQNFTYVYLPDDEYANCLFPVNWIDWSTFCTDPQLQRFPNDQQKPLTQVWNDVASFVNAHWETFKIANNIVLQPPECQDDLNRYISERPERIRQSKIDFHRRMKTMQEQANIEKGVNLLKKCQNLILTGAPGTGKTFLAKQIAEMMILGRIHDNEQPLTDAEKAKLAKQMGFCQFHPSYDYTDFVEGLRPTESNGNIGFERKNGKFKAFCVDALKEQEKDENGDYKYKYIFIIDEINRGDIAKIFGELFYAIDKDYRGEDGSIKTQYDELIKDGEAFKGGFFVPMNVYIIGTMNDIDRNVESMDFAIRRRFTWKEIKPEDTQDSILSSLDNIEEVKERMNNLNSAIRDAKQLGKSYCIGASYFKKIKENDWETLWELYLCPLLKEYVRGLPNADELMSSFIDKYVLGLPNADKMKKQFSDAL